MKKIDINELYKELKHSIFDLNDGIYQIKGKSGCGKTTILKNLYNSNKSKVAYFDIEQSLIFGNVFDNLCLTEEEYKKSYIYKKYPNLLHQIISCNEFYHENDYNYKFSSGEKQRFALLRNIHTEKKVILLDEPFSNLDISSAKSFLIFLDDFSKEFKKIFVIVNHLDIHVKSINNIEVFGRVNNELIINF